MDVLNEGRLRSGKNRRREGGGKPRWANKNTNTGGDSKKKKGHARDNGIIGERKGSWRMY